MESCHVTRGRLLARVLVIGYAFLIALVSFVPGRLDLRGAVLADQALHFLRTAYTSVYYLSHYTNDYLSNFILYLPWGLLAPLALTPCPAAAPAARLRRLARGPWLGAAFALAMELGQIALPNREPDLGDVLMGALGYLLGFRLTAWAMRRFHAGPAWLLGARGAAAREEVARLLALGYALLGLLVSLAPFELLGKKMLLAKLANLPQVSGHLWLSLLGPWPAQRLADVALLAAGFAPLGFLGRLARPAWGRRPRLQALGAGLALAAALETVQFFIAGRTSDVAQVLGAGAGVLAGGALAGWWDYPARLAPGARHPFGPVLLACALALLAAAWYPLRARGGPAWQALLAGASWIPLREYILHRPLELWPRVYGAVGGFIPLGMLLEPWLREAVLAPRRRRAALPWALAILGLGAVVRVLGRAFFNGAPIDSTIILGHLAGGLAGCILARLLARQPLYQSGLPSNVASCA